MVLGGLNNFIHMQDSEYKFQHTYKDLVLLKISQKNLCKILQMWVFYYIKHKKKALIINCISKYIILNYSIKSIIPKYSKTGLGQRPKMTLHLVHQPLGGTQGCYYPSHIPLSPALVLLNDEGTVSLKTMTGLLYGVKASKEERWVHTMWSPLASPTQHSGQTGWGEDQGTLLTHMPWSKGGPQLTLPLIPYSLAQAGCLCAAHPITSCLWVTGSGLCTHSCVPPVRSYFDLWGNWPGQSSQSSTLWCWCQWPKEFFVPFVFMHSSPLMSRRVYLYFPQGLSSITVSPSLPRILLYHTDNTICQLVHTAWAPSVLHPELASFKRLLRKVSMKEWTKQILSFKGILNFWIPSHMAKDKYNVLACNSYTLSQIHKHKLRSIEKLNTPNSSVFTLFCFGWIVLLSKLFFLEW